MGKALSKKLYAINDDLLVHWCPACSILHPIFINKPSPLGELWEWDGNIEHPTFTPGFHPSAYCKYTIKKGVICFSEDCRHVLQNQSMPMTYILL